MKARKQHVFIAGIRLDSRSSQGVDGKIATIVTIHVIGEPREGS